MANPIIKGIPGCRRATGGAFFFLIFMKFYGKNWLEINLVLFIVGSRSRPSLRNSGSQLFQHAVSLMRTATKDTQGYVTTKNIK